MPPMPLETFIQCHSGTAKGAKANVTSQLLGLDVGNLAPEIVADLSMLAEDLTPGGVNCGLQFVTPTARPPMGPYWHISPAEVLDTTATARSPPSLLPSSSLPNDDFSCRNGSTASANGGGGDGVDKGAVNQPRLKAAVIVPLSLTGYGGTVDTAVLCTQGCAEVLVVPRQSPRDTFDLLSRCVDHTATTVTAQEAASAATAAAAAAAAAAFVSTDEGEDRGSALPIDVWAWPLHIDRGSEGDRWGIAGQGALVDVFRLSAGDLCHVPKGCLYAVRSHVRSRVVDSNELSNDSATASSNPLLNSPTTSHHHRHSLCGVATWHWLSMGRHRHFDSASVAGVGGKGWRAERGGSKSNDDAGGSDASSSSSSSSSSSATAAPGSEVESELEAEFRVSLAFAAEQRKRSLRAAGQEEDEDDEKEELDATDGSRGGRRTSGMAAAAAGVVKRERERKALEGGGAAGVTEQVIQQALKAAVASATSLEAWERHRRQREEKRERKKSKERKRATQKQTERIQKKKEEEEKKEEEKEEEEKEKGDEAAAADGEATAKSSLPRLPNTIVGNPWRFWVDSADSSHPLPLTTATNPPSALSVSSLAAAAGDPAAAVSGVSGSTSLHADKSSEGAPLAAESSLRGLAILGRELLTRDETRVKAAAALLTEHHKTQQQTVVAGNKEEDAAAAAATVATAADPRHTDIHHQDVHLGKTIAAFSSPPSSIPPPPSVAAAASSYSSTLPLAPTLTLPQISEVEGSGSGATAGGGGTSREGADSESTDTATHAATTLTVPAAAGSVATESESAAAAAAVAGGKEATSATEATSALSLVPTAAFSTVTPLQTLPPLAPSSSSSSSEPKPLQKKRITPTLVTAPLSPLAAASPSNTVTANVTAVEAASVTVDAWLSESDNPNGVDPYACEGFACVACGAEMANSYLHCSGCEFLLGADYNLCPPCHKAMLQRSTSHWPSSVSAFPSSSAIKIATPEEREGPGEEVGEEEEEEEEEERSTTTPQSEHKKRPREVGNSSSNGGDDDGDDDAGGSLGKVNGGSLREEEVEAGAAEGGQEGREGHSSSLATKAKKARHSEKEQKQLQLQPQIQLQLQGSLSTQRVHWVPNNADALATSVMLPNGRCSNEKVQLSSNSMAAGVGGANAVAGGGGRVSPSDSSSSSSSSSSGASQLASLLHTRLPPHRVPHRACWSCGQCSACACFCHSDFELRCRFEPLEDTWSTLKTAGRILGN